LRSIGSLQAQCRRESRFRTLRGAQRALIWPPSNVGSAARSALRLQIRGEAPALVDYEKRLSDWSITIEDPDEFAADPVFWVALDAEYRRLTQ
jgi:hypothetical protein